MTFHVIRRTILVSCALVVCACSAGPARPVLPSGLAGRGSGVADNWVIVAPGGGGPSNTPAQLDVFRGTARAVGTVPGPPPGRRGVTVYPWAVSGQYVAAVTGIRESARKGGPGEGVAYAFRPGGGYVRLGRAIAVFAASRPGRFWIRSARVGGAGGARPRHCTVTEVSAAGRRIAGPLAAPCARWIIAAVPGGFVSVPTSTANAARIPQGGQLSPETPVQLWDPVSGTVVRTYRIDPGWIYGASGQYLAWRSRSANGQQVPRVAITNLSTGKTQKFAVPLSAKQVMWRDPVLAPRGPYLAWQEISKATFRKFSAEVPSGAGGVPDLQGPGRVKILDFAARRVIVDRALTIGWAGGFGWSPDNRDLFVTASPTHLHVVPTRSDAAPIRNLRLPSYHDVPDTQIFIVALRTGPGR